MTPMSLERRRVVRAMQALGWTATRKEGGTWEFRRPDTNGWFDVVRVKQANLTWGLIMRHDEEFQQIVSQLWLDTVRTRYPSVFRDIPDEKTDYDEG